MTQRIDLVADVAGFIDVVGRAIYRSPHAVVRELVQNAHDSTTEILHTATPLSDYQPRIDIYYDERRRRLAVVDNGAGMSGPQIADRLNNFARSSKPDLERKLASETGVSPLFIGQYGVGFVSAMATSRSVSVLSTRSDLPGVEWTFRAGDSYASLSYPTGSECLPAIGDDTLSFPAPHGTIVWCDLSAPHADDFGIDAESIREDMLNVTQLLPTPVYFNGEHLNVNAELWDRAVRTDSLDAWTQFVTARERDEPLLTIPLNDGEGTRGVLWIPPRRHIMGRAHLDVFVRRMHVLVDNDLLIPNWATFVRGVIDTSAFERLVNGTDVRRDQRVRMLEQEIHREILRALDRVNRDGTGLAYEEILGPHEDQLIAVALDRPELLDAMSQNVRFDTTTGKITLGELREAMRKLPFLDSVEVAVGSPAVPFLFFYDQKLMRRNAELLCQLTGVPVLDLTNATRKDFARISAARSGCALKHVSELAESVSVPSVRSCDGLVAALRARGLRARECQLPSESTPLAIVHAATVTAPERAFLMQELSSASSPNSGPAPSPFLPASRANALFYVNSRNPLVAALCQHDQSDQLAVVRALLGCAYLATFEQVSRADVEIVNRSICDALQHLLSRTSQTAKSHADRADSSPVRAFLVRPYDRSFDRMEEAVREVFEMPPFCFQVETARERTRALDRRAHLREYIESADLFIADITQQSANVMMEVGAAMYGGGHGKPLVALRATTAASEPAQSAEGFGERIFDLADLVFIGYGGSAKPCDIAREIRSQVIESTGRVCVAQLLRFLGPPSRAAVTRTLLRHLSVRLTTDQEDDVLRLFPRISDVLSTDPGALARRLSIREPVAALLLEGIREAFQ